jgi:ribosomal protein S21
MRKINAQVKLDPKKSTDKAYFDKMWYKFSRDFMNSGVIDELRLKRCYYKPSMRRKIKKQLVRNKWKHLS